MPTERPDLPEPLVVPDVATLVERYTPELRPKPAVDRISAYFALGMMALFFSVGGFNLFGWVGALVAGIVVMVASVAGVEGHRARLAREFDEMVAQRPWELYGGIAERFRGHLDEQRTRLLGPKSEWAQARAPLEEAYREARRSLAYWEERQAQAPDRPGLEEHLSAARRLADKFGSALEELDGRSEILLDFFDACEAKLSVLESSRRDVEESERLARLSDRAEEVTLDAGQALGAIARDVLHHALEVGEALGAVERLRIQDTAAQVPVNEIEHVADRILASSESERRALAELVSSVEAGPTPGADG